MPKDSFEEKFAKAIYDRLRIGNIKDTLHIISSSLEEEKTDKTKMTKVPLLNTIGRKLGKLLIKENRKFDRLMGLWKEGGREERLIIISAVGTISKNDYDGAKQFVLGVLNDISDWEICDQLALRVVVNLVVQNQEEMFSLMRQWINSKNKWVKRLAVATIPPYIRTMKSESKACLELLNKAMEETDRDVKKAIGWALREISKKDSKSVFEFLKSWAKAGNKNIVWIIKEGMKKLSKEQQEELKILIEESIFRK